VGEFTAPCTRRRSGDSGWTYRDAEGRRIPGVTTIMDEGLPKKALINWAGNATANYALDNWDHLSTLPPSERLEELKKGRYQNRDAAALRGTEVHAYAQKLVMGERVEVPDEYAAHVEACARFIDAFDVQPVLVEFGVVSYQHGYAGSGDLIADLTLPAGPKRLLLDFKTSKSGIFGEVALQLAGYRYADVYLAADGTEKPMIPVDGCAAVHIRSNGYDLRMVDAGPNQHRELLYVQRVGRFSANSRDLIGPPVRPPAGHSDYTLTRNQ